MFLQQSQQFAKIGAYNESGRGATIWDTFVGANTRNMPGADVANCPGEGPQIANNGTKIYPDGYFNRLTSGCKANAIMEDSNNGVYGNTGNIAAQQYNDYENQIKFLAKMGLPNYRFSVAWSRVCRTGICCTDEEWKKDSSNFSACSGVNPEGLAHYNKVIEKLLENNIDPLVTLYHWDLPQGLENIFDEIFAKITKI